MASKEAERPAAKPGKEKKPKLHSVDPNTVPEKVIKYTYDVQADKWTQSTGLVLLEASPFDEGSMRAAFCMLDPSKPEGQQRYVAKMSKNPKEDKSTYFLDVEMQALAKLFAEEFNKRKPPKPVDFNEASVVKCLERRGQPLLAVEPWLEGNFNKYSNNYGFVSYDDRNTPQAFSHFTYCHSGGKLLICDIQGVADKYTDPQIHSRDGNGFGKGNLGPEGMLKFFQSHRCNSICHFLNLPAHQPKQGERVPPNIPERVPAAGKKDSNDGQLVSPRAQQPSGMPDNPLDLKLLGLSREQFDFISKHFQLCATEGPGRLGRRGVAELCAKLGAHVGPEDADRLVRRLAPEGQPIDLRRFLWWWCGIEEPA
eukprot:EG_transcript_16220